MKGLIVTFHAGGTKGFLIEINRRPVPLYLQSMAADRRLFIHLP